MFDPLVFFALQCPITPGLLTPSARIDESHELTSWRQNAFSAPVYGIIDTDPDRIFYMVSVSVVCSVNVNTSIVNCYLYQPLCEGILAGARGSKCLHSI